MENTQTLITEGRNDLANIEQTLHCTKNKFVSDLLIKFLRLFTVPYKY